jgi:hypothetical protein
MTRVIGYDDGERTLAVEHDPAERLPWIIVQQDDPAAQSIVLSPKDLAYLAVWLPTLALRDPDARRWIEDYLRGSTEAHLRSYAARLYNRSPRLCWAVHSFADRVGKVRRDA